MFARQTRLRSLACGLTLLVAPQAMASMTDSYELFTYYDYVFSHAPASASVSVQGDPESGLTAVFRDDGETEGHYGDPYGRGGYSMGFFMVGGDGHVDLSGKTLSFDRGELREQLDREPGYLYSGIFYLGTPLGFMTDDGSETYLPRDTVITGSFTFGAGNEIVGWNVFAGNESEDMAILSDGISLEAFLRPYTQSPYSLSPLSDPVPGRSVFEYAGFDVMGYSMATRPGYWTLQVSQYCLRYDDPENKDMSLCAPPPAPVPLPASAVFLIGALGGLGLVARRRRAG